jgi:chromosome segregation ATPase
MVTIEQLKHTIIEQQRVVRELRARLAEVEAKLKSWQKDMNAVLAQRDDYRARVARLEEALRKVRDYDCYKHPDDDIIAIREAAIKESENCTACQHAKKAKWPPSGLCNEHYSTVTRAQERVSQMFSHKQTWGPREIARRALEEK